MSVGEARAQSSKLRKPHAEERRPSRRLQDWLRKAYTMRSVGGPDRAVVQEKCRSCSFLCRRCSPICGCVRTHRVGKTSFCCIKRLHDAVQAQWKWPSKPPSLQQHFSSTFADACGRVDQHSSACKLVHEVIFRASIHFSSKPPIKIAGHFLKKYDLQSLRLVQRLNLVLVASTICGSPGGSTCLCLSHCLGIPCGCLNISGRVHSCSMSYVHLACGWSLCLCV